jgi:Fe-S cluster assembly protein SufD
VSAAAAETGVYRESFDRFAARSAKSDPAWLRERRGAAMARFVERGFPGPRDEAWRHTPIGPVVRTPFEPPDPSARAGEPLDLGGPRIVLINGRFSRELSSGSRAGVDLLPLSEALARRPELEGYLGRIAGDSASVFCDLNTAFAEDGAVVLLAPGAVPDEPIHVAHLHATDGTPTVAYPRTLVVAGEGSQCRIVESFAGPEGRAYLTNSVTEVHVGRNASVDHAKLQREGPEGFHFATLAVRLERDARFADRALTLGAALSRNDIDVRFEGEGGECTLDGLFLVDGKRLADTHSRIDHAQPHCSSRELYKGVLEGAARGVFNGLIVVRPGAQKTDAWQTNKNLLLSKDALVHSTPQLEILADDVKCKHGSTTGQLDPSALFYLRSRGIDEASARSLLVYAFASDLVGRLEVGPLREVVKRHLRERLGGGAEIREAVA